MLKIEGSRLCWSALFTPIIAREGTRDAYRLEVDLLPMVHEMRRRGIRIDQDAAEQAYDLFIGKRNSALKELSDQHGAAVSMVEIRGRKWLEETFDGYDISYPRTAKGNPSFSSKKSGWMAEHAHWLPRGIALANRYNHAGEMFIRGHILNHIVNGRIYGEIRPHLSDEGGTISFRFSYSKPPLQQMPKRDPEIGQPIRECYLPEEGEFWATADANQQEFRGWVHYGVERGLPSAIEAAKAYHNDPDTDFHKLVGEMTGLDRDNAKTANFAKGYGSGVETFAKTISKSQAEAAAIMAQYDERLPFVSKLFENSKRRRHAPASPGSMTARCGTGTHTRHPGRTKTPARSKRHGAASLIPSIPGMASNCVAQGHARHSTRWFRVWARDTQNYG